MVTLASLKNRAGANVEQPDQHHGHPGPTGGSPASARPGNPATCRKTASGSGCGYPLNTRPRETVKGETPQTPSMDCKLPTVPERCVATVAGIRPVTPGSNQTATTTWRWRRHYCPLLARRGVRRNHITAFGVLWSLGGVHGIMHRTPTAPSPYGTAAAGRAEPGATRTAMASPAGGLPGRLAFELLRAVISAGSGLGVPEGRGGLRVAVGRSPAAHPP